MSDAIGLTIYIGGICLMWLVPICIIRLKWPWNLLKD